MALYTRQSNLAQQEVVVVPTPVVELPTPTPTFTVTPIPPLSTNTPEPTPTGTLVVPLRGQEAAQTGASPTPPDITGGNEPTPVNTLVIQPPTPVPLVGPVATLPPAEIPQGGGVLASTSDNYLIGAGLVVLLLLVWGLVNYLRSPSSLSGQ